MDTKDLRRMKRGPTKERSRSRSKNGEPEIFVIPPYLLQKLGINLGNVESTQECPTALDTIDTTASNNKLNAPIRSETSEIIPEPPINTEKETSILETANLMTKSVLLSPTFIPISANIIPGELEISNDVTTENNGANIVHMSNHETHRDIIKEQATSVVFSHMQANSELAETEIYRDLIKEQDITSNVSPQVKIKPADNEIHRELIKDIDEPSQLKVTTPDGTDITRKQFLIEINRTEEPSQNKRDHKSDENLVSTPMQEVKINHLRFSDDFSKNIKTDITEKANRILSTDDHPDEAYSSDCSNSNIGPVENTDSVNYIPEHVIKSPTLITSKNKINVISEEILSSSQLNELKNLHSPNLSDFIPVKINTVITGNKNKDTFEKNTTDFLFYKKASKNSDQINQCSTKTHQSQDCIVISNKEKGDLTTDLRDDINIITELPMQIKDKINLLGTKCIDEYNLIKDAQEVSCTEYETMSQTKNKVLNDSNKLEFDTSDSNLDVSIDFEVMDIEENDESLEEFVNGITSTDSNEILDKIERNENGYFNNSVLPKAITDDQSDKIEITDDIFAKRDETTKVDNTTNNDSGSNFKVHDVIPNVDENIVTDCSNNLQNSVSENKSKEDENKMVTSALNHVESKKIKLDLAETLKVISHGESNKDSKQFEIKSNLQQLSNSHLCNSNLSLQKEIINVYKPKKAVESVNASCKVIVPREKVEEIAVYLSQSLSSSRLKSKAKLNIRKEVTKQPKKNCLKSKLSIQGVEKPGGFEKNTKNAQELTILKTYARTKRPKPSYVPVLQSACGLDAELLLNISEDVKLQNTSITLSSYCQTEKFCLCHDFGSLAFYDCDSHYEHIHFWEHESIFCNRDILFSIYDEEDTFKFNNYDTEINTHIVEENPSIIVRSICWNNIADDHHMNISRENLENAGIVDSLETECSQNHAENKTTYNVSTVLSDIKNEEEKHNENSSDSFTEIVIEIDDGKNEDDIAEILPDFKSFEAGIADSLETEATKLSVNLVETKISDEVSCSTSNTKNEEQPHESSSDSFTEIVIVIDNGESEFDSLGFQNAEHSEIIEMNNSDIVEEEIINDSHKSKENSKLERGSRINKIEKKGKGKKRKYSSKIIEENVNSIDDIEPSSKKNVKCGVCEQLLSEVEWEDHNDKEHCYIAWKAGDSVDFKDSELAKKLELRLTNNSKLKCTFCSVEKKKVKNFLIHVRKCLKLKDSPNTSNDTSIVTEAISEDNNLVEETNSSSEEMTKCGVCKDEIKMSCWIEHIATKHDYLAWKDEEPALNMNDEEEIRQHLYHITKQYGGLNCSKCGRNRKYVKSYLQHIKNCEVNEDSLTESTIKIEVENATAVPPKHSKSKCGVCGESKKDSSWIDHIAKEHNYLAWKAGETPVNLNDEEEVRQHLHSIAKQSGGLICSKCGLNRKYAKSYLQHISQCGGVDTSNDSVVNETTDSNSIFDESEDKNALVKCGVCQKEILSVQWILHIQTAHNYLAWKEGKRSLDLNNAEEVQNHLYTISKFVGGLTCSKCGLVRKYVKAYQSHIATCDVVPLSFEVPITNPEEGIPTCGVCLKKVVTKDWIKHKMEKHYNIAWTSNQTPIDIKNPYAVERLLKEYKEYKKKLVCKVCRISRASYMGFYAHILTCGKTEEEIEMFQNKCDICNKKYLCIYQHQHMAAHREQEYTKERRLKEAEHKEKIKEEVMVVETTPGRRRAAEKARSVIENYQSSSQFSHNCPTCGFGTDHEKQMEKHECKEIEADCSGSDVSDDMEESGDETDESDVDSDVSDEEQLSTKKRHREYVPTSTKVSRLPFSVKSANAYLLQSGVEYCKMHFTTESLFVDWNKCECEPVPDDQLTNYLPPLEESCKVKFSEDSWTTYNRFEAKKGKGYSMFVGACIQCISWIPNAGDSDEDNYMAIACHSGADLPRYGTDVIPHHSGLIQIWNFGVMKTLPKLVLGIAHDYGTVWGMDWCPSGARDPLPNTDGTEASRLGLLAVSCSNGAAYVFSVPYPSTIPLKSDNLFYKLKPVAELRLTTGSNRKLYQATSLSWSPQKGHTFIVVGYGDGTTAYFDLSTDSPLLKTNENDVTILYPYHDERPHNSCVLGVNVYAGGGQAQTVGAVCSAAPTGAQAASRAAPRPVRVHSRLCCSVAMFQPLWPAALLAGDDAIISSSANELEWWGGGRRLGAVAACGGCAHCARVALCVPPLVRLVRLHPAYAELKKQTVGSLQMVPIGKKRKVANDELTIKVEPITYEDAVQKYGIEFKLDKKIIAPQTNKPREQYPDRFPLAAVRSMAFCLSRAHHGKLAVATHAGVVFLVTV